MVLKVVPLAKLLPHAHFPVNEDPSRIPSPGDCLLQKSSGLFAYRKRPTIDLKVSKFGSFATCETQINHTNQIYRIFKSKTNLMSFLRKIHIFAGFIESGHHENC